MACVNVQDILDRVQAVCCLYDIWLNKSTSVCLDIWNSLVNGINRNILISYCITERPLGQISKSYIQ